MSHKGKIPKKLLVTKKLTSPDKIKGQFVTKKLTSQDMIIKNALGREQFNFHLTPGQEKTLRRASSA